MVSLIIPSILVDAKDSIIMRLHLPTVMQIIQFAENENYKLLGIDNLFFSIIHEH